MKENSHVRIRIVGHTDNTGSINFNNNLYLNRANSVRDALIEKGIGSERIIVEGKGSAEPVDTNDTEEGRSRNRRVEFEIL
jgi:outer membrane protein OmpA-like peptidoglycan-associated protein